MIIITALKQVGDKNTELRLNKEQLRNEMLKYLKTHVRHVRRKESSDLALENTEVKQLQFCDAFILLNGT